MLTHLLRWRLVLEEAAPGAAHHVVLVALLGHRFHIVNGGAQQFVLQQTRVGQTVASRFANVALLLVGLRRVLVRLVDGGEVRLPVVVGTAQNNTKQTIRFNYK